MTSLQAQESTNNHKATSSSEQLSLLERLKARSAKKRFLQMHSVWQKGTNLEVIHPEAKPQATQAAHIVEVIDVDSFRQTPTREEYNAQRLSGNQLNQQQQITIHHLLERETKATSTPEKQFTQPLFDNAKLFGNVKQFKPIKKKQFVYDEKTLQEGNITPRDLKKITEILPYYDYNSSKSGSRLKSKLPAEIELSQENQIERTYPDSFFQWKASNISYCPLYFQDVQLERYGHTYPDYIQPFVSVTKFGTQLIGLPYQMGIDSPHKTVTPLGYYQPGEPAPKLCYQIPLSLKGAVYQAATVTGLIYLIP